MAGDDFNNLIKHGIAGAAAAVGQRPNIITAMNDAQAAALIAAALVGKIAFPDGATPEDTREMLIDTAVMLLVTAQIRIGPVAQASGPTVMARAVAQGLRTQEGT